MMETGTFKASTSDNRDAAQCPCLHTSYVDKPEFHDSRARHATDANPAPSTRQHTLAFLLY